MLINCQVLWFLTSQVSFHLMAPNGTQRRDTFYKGLASYGLGWPQLEEVCENIKDQRSPPRVKDLLSGTQALLPSQVSLF